MKYPAVFRDTNTSSSGDSNQQTVLIYQDGDAIHLTGKFKGQYTARWSTFNAINITREYLQNTWGVVESKEHAEFITELAKNCGIRLYSTQNEKKYFCYDGKYLWFTAFEHYALNKNRKQITIPLPPKAEENEAGHNLVFAASECKEWPCVNDKVYVTKKVLDNNSMLEAAELISETYCTVVSKFTHNEVEFCVLKNDNSAYTSLILDLCLADKTIVKEKPKTPEEALRDDISAYLCDKYKFIYSIEALEITDELLTKYNITPKEV